jgi:hypothetical protein
LQDLAQRERIDLCVISETHHFPNLLFNLCTFSAYRQNRLDRGGGGAAILIRRDIQCSVISLPALQRIEAVGVSLHLINQGPLSVYAAPPSMPITTLFTNCSSVNVCRTLTASILPGTAVSITQTGESSILIPSTADCASQDRITQHMARTGYQKY